MTSAVSPNSRQHRRSVLVALGVVLAVIVALVSTPTTYGTLTDTIANPTNTAASSVFGSTTTCAAAYRVGSPYLTYPFAELSGTTAADVSGSNRPGTYRTPGVAYAQPGPCPRDTGRAVTLSGTGFVNGAASVNNPQVFSVQLWFRTTTTNGGRLIGLGNQTGNNASTVSDRHIYMTNNGALVFGVSPASTNRTISSTQTYRDGDWHHAVATLSSAAGETRGMRLYVDGELVASDSTTTTARAYATNAISYWRIGADTVSGWPNAPTSLYFTGGVAWASVHTAALTPAQVAATYASGR